MCGNRPHVLTVVIDCFAYSVKSKYVAVCLNGLNSQVFNEKAKLLENMVEAMFKVKPGCCVDQ